MGWLAVLVCVAAAPLFGASLYLGMLTLFSRRVKPAPVSARTLRFDVVVPAHDEAQGIAGTVRNLLAIDYPKDRFRVCVVADNCSDATAARAMEAGAVAWVRTDAAHRGKGYALELAFERSLAERFADAVVVVDADTTVTPNLLAAFAARIEGGAGAMQAEYAVSNATESWRTQLMEVAFALFHGVRSHARERLRLSCGLRGNGMCFTRDLLERHPHRAFSLVEDLEYGIALGLGGERVVFVPEVKVFGEMVSSEKASRSQRRRWEEGRRGIVRRLGPALLRKAMRGDAVSADLFMDVAVPPLSRLVGLTALGLGVAAALAWTDRSLGFALFPWALSALFLLAYVARGWVLSGTGLRGLLALARAPLYLAWKLALHLSPGRRRAGGEWVRTARNGELAP